MLKETAHRHDVVRDEPRPGWSVHGASWYPPEAWRSDLTSLYLHVPFCAHHCGYCSFSVVAGRDELLPAYLKAVCHELLLWPPGPPLETLYWGGGTPSHLPIAAFDHLVAALLERFALKPNTEWTVEANPSDVNDTWCRQMADRGVTRVSIGAQSFNDEKLKILERDHSSKCIRKASQAVRRAGLVLSLDLIFAVPGESLETWKRDLEEACSLEPHHISTYALTWEPGTRFYAALRKRRLQPVDNELEATMYEWAIEFLEQRGWHQYEVSNFAKESFRCRHNELYWMGGNYLGIGPSAASHHNGCRWANHRSTWTYIQRIQSRKSPITECEILSKEVQIRERLVFGLRRLDGVDRRQFRAVTGHDPEEIVGDVLRQWMRWGVVHMDDRSIRFTRRGLLVSDALFPELLEGT